MAVIGLDLDGVVYHFTKTFVSWMVERRPDLSEAIGDVNAEAPNWDWFINWPLTRHEFILEMEIACAHKRLFWNAELYEANIPAQVSRLRRAGHTIEVVTHRFTPMSHAATWDCLLRDRIYPCGVTFAKDKTSVKCDYFLEDNIDNYRALREAGVKAYLVNRKYNLNQSASFRVSAFEDFVDIVLEETS